MTINPWRTIAELRTTNGKLMSDNDQLTTENAWLLDYALEGDALLTVARDQRNRLNEQCDQLTHDASEQLGDLHRLLLETTQARDDARKQLSALTTPEQRAAWEAAQTAPPQDVQYAVKSPVEYAVTPQDERPKRPRGKGKAG